MNNLVFVIGAGASAEFGLPVGSKLQDQIAQEAKLGEPNQGYPPFSHNSVFRELLPAAAGLERYKRQDEMRLGQKAVSLSLGVQSSYSIDNFLDSQGSDAELVGIGKLAIARCILKAEAESSIGYESNTDRFAGSRGHTRLRPDQTWLGQLLKLLSAGRNFDGFCYTLQHIDFICFNYDRCIERYFHYVVSLLYPLHEYDAERLDASLNIIRPYGTLGELSANESGKRVFGNSEDPQYVLAASARIRTFTEGMHSKVRQEIASSLSNGAILFFLGYGFIGINNNFLFDHGPFGIPSVYGTVLNMKEERIAAIRDETRSNCMASAWASEQMFDEKDPILKSEGCSDLIDRFAHVISSFGR